MAYLYLFILFLSLFGWFSKRTYSSSNKVEYNRENYNTETENYIKLEQDKIDFLINKYNCEDQEDLVLILKEKNIYGELTEDEKKFFDDPEWDLLKSMAELSTTVKGENDYGRTLAIRDLLNDNYHMQPIENGNPHKEVINFTLNYFSENPHQIEDELLVNFPIMHQYIRRYIHQNQENINSNVHFNEQIMYNEFLRFCIKHFRTQYSIKDIRDEQIKNHFKIMDNDIINLLDNV
jgi:hypothetical protein